MKHLDTTGIVHGWGRIEAGPVFLDELAARLARHYEMAQVKAFLNQRHDLGCGRVVGRALVQVAHHHARRAALLCGSAAMRLKDRDEFICCTCRQRAERLGLILQKRRFLVLSAVRIPNLASRALALGERHLPEHWRQAHGRAPVQAEPGAARQPAAGGPAGVNPPLGGG